MKWFRSYAKEFMEDGGRTDKDDRFGENNRQLLKIEFIIFTFKMSELLLPQSIAI
jgi:hypothetical protein